MSPWPREAPEVSTRDQAATVATTARLPETKNLHVPLSKNQNEVAPLRES